MWEVRKKNVYFRRFMGEFGFREQHDVRAAKRYFIEFIRAIEVLR